MLFFEWFTGFSIGLCVAYLIFLTLNLFLTFRFKNRLAKLLCILHLSYAANTVIFPEEVIGSLGYFLGLAVLVLLFFKESWYKKLSAAILIFPITTAINYITQDIGLLIWLHIYNRDMSDAAQTILHTCTLFLRIPIWFLLYRCMKNWLSPTVHLLTTFMWIVLDMISVSAFTGIISIIYVCNSNNSYLAYPACIACAVTSLGCCYLCTYMAKTVRADMQLEAFRYQDSYYKELEQNQQTVRRLRHDMKNHLNIIGTLLRDRRLEEAEAYFSSLSQEFTTNLRAYCPNSTVNAVLNSKYQAAREAGISCDFMVDLKEQPRLENLDLCALMGNTLDNAIEACRQLPAGQSRCLSLKTRCKNGFFSYALVNTKGNEIRKKNGRFLTGKKEKDGHGIGLLNVQSIVEKYHGNLNISYDRDSFSVTVLIQPKSAS